MTLLLTIHSIVRWLIVIVAVALVVKFSIGWLKKQPFDNVAQRLLSAFSGLLDTQLLLGLIYFTWSGMAGVGFPRQRWEHFFLMVIAVVVGHLPAMWKKKDDVTRYRNSLLAVLVALLIIFLAIAPIGGWARWWHITGLF
jgi:hypothetical protein